MTERRAGLEPGKSVVRGLTPDCLADARERHCGKCHAPHGRIPTFAVFTSSHSLAARNHHRRNVGGRAGPSTTPPLARPRPQGGGARSTGTACAGFSARGFETSRRWFRADHVTSCAALVLRFCFPDDDPA